MSQRDEALDRIAAALERLAPQPPAPVDWSAHPAYIWTGGEPYCVEALDALPLPQLRGIDAQKAAVCENLKRLASGAAAHDILLWGARGMGKSALIRAAISDLQQSGEAIALVQVMPAGFDTIPQLIGALSVLPRAFCALPR